MPLGRIALLISLLLATCLGLKAQEQHGPASMVVLAQVPSTLSASNQAVPTIHTTARLVVLDVVVTDGHGHSVVGLKQSDFALSEDGVPQTLASFSGHDATMAASPGSVSPRPEPPSNTFTDTPAETGNGAMTVIVMGNLSFHDAPYARTQLRAYLKTANPVTPIAIFKQDWYGLHLVQDFTTDLRVLQDAAASKRMTHPFGLIPRFVPPKSPGLTLPHYLAGIPGRINLIWITTGGGTEFGDGGRRDPFPDISSFIRDLNGSTDVLQLSRVAVYAVDARGVELSWNAGREVMQDAAQSSKSISSTGGKLFYNTNGIKQAIAEVVNTGSHYYTLSYSPTNPNWNGAYRRIKVDVNAGVKESSLEKLSDWLNDPVKVEYQGGYFARDRRPRADPLLNPQRKLISASPNGMPPGTRQAPETPMQSAMTFGNAVPCQINFTIGVTPSAQIEENKPGTPLPQDNFLKPQWRSSPFRNYRIHYWVSPNDLQLQAVPNNFYEDTFEAITLVYQDDGVMANSIVFTAPIKVDAAGMAKMTREGFAFDETVAIPVKGNFFLRAGVHELTSGRIGVLEVPTESIELPEASTRPGPASTVH